MKIRVFLTFYFAFLPCLVSIFTACFAPSRFVSDNPAGKQTGFLRADLDFRFQ